MTRRKPRSASEESAFFGESQRVGLDRGFDPFLDLGFWQRANFGGGNLSLIEYHQCRHAAHAVFGGRVRAFVDVELGDCHPVLQLRRQFLERWADNAAWPALLFS